MARCGLQMESVMFKELTILSSLLIPGDTGIRLETSIDRATVYYC